MLNLDQSDDIAAWNRRAPQATPELSTASRPEAVDEEENQPFYDLAWEHGARRYVSFAGDDLEGLSFSPDQFETFCAALAARAAPGLALTSVQIMDLASDYRSIYRHGGTSFDDFDVLGFARALLAAAQNPCQPE